MEKELQHWGIKGMKWGIRRFQNRDGTLTALGKKREAKERSEGGEKKTSINDKLKGRGKSDKVDISKMTDDDLKKAISRAQLEKQYRDLKPKQVSFGKEFVQKSVMPAVNDAGKKLMTDFLIDRGMKALGLKDVGSDEVNVLRKKYEKLDLTKKIKDLEKGSDPDRDEYEQRKKAVERMRIDRDYEELTHPSKESTAAKEATYKENLAKIVRNDKYLAEHAPQSTETKKKKYKLKR